MYSAHEETYWIDSIFMRRNEFDRITDFWAMQSPYTNQGQGACTRVWSGLDTIYYNTVERAHFAFPLRKEQLFSSRIIIGNRK